MPDPILYLLKTISEKIFLDQFFHLLKKRDNTYSIIKEITETPDISDLIKKLDQRDYEIFNTLMSNKEIKRNNLISQLWFTNRRGLMFLGPSGAGKSSLINSFLKYGKTLSSGTDSTTGINKRYTTLYKRYTLIRDTAGLVQHDLDVAIRDFINNPPDILCLVFAAGYLETANSAILTRTSTTMNPKKFDSLEEYITACSEEEIEWVQYLIDKIQKIGTNNKPRKRIKHIIIVVNKRDLWNNKYSVEEMKERYTNNPVIKDLVEMLIMNYKPYFLCVSSDYTDFQEGKAAPSNFPRRLSRASVFKLRAYIHHIMSDLS